MMKIHPMIIQGGMGVAISTWQLANAVSKAGQLGVISGTGIGIILIARLMDGDPDGHMRRALAHFPDQTIAQKILDAYFVEGGKAPNTPYKRPSMWTLNPSATLEELTVVANFVEVWLAKEGHDNPVGINLLEKVQMPTMASLYGAMLAGVDYVIMGAGIPIQIPGILDKLATHEPVQYRLDVHGESEGENTILHFDTARSFASIRNVPLKRPLFLPIISSVVLAMALQKRSTGEINGFIVEMPSAGGHNAPPRVKDSYNERGEPLYGHKDDVNLQRLAALGLPFWLAGGYGHADKLQEALALGAEGIQVGTAFAFCEEAGFTTEIKQQVLQQVLNDEVDIFTDPVASPTGFPFKVVQLEGTMSDESVYTERPRLCDVGYLRQLYRDDASKLQYRCAAEPVDTYVKKGGAIEDTVGRKCLCNQLGAAAGFAQQRTNGYIEQPLVTSGDALKELKPLISYEKASYSAAEVIDYLLNT